ncbi:hypothetical protein ACWCZB_34065, partial [Streptomyces sp. NPDC001500]
AAVYCLGPAAGAVLAVDLGPALTRVRRRAGGVVGAPVACRRAAARRPPLRRRPPLIRRPPPGVRMPTGSSRPTPTRPSTWRPTGRPGRGRPA